MRWFNRKKTRIAPILLTLEPPGPSPWYLYRRAIRTPIGVFRWNAIQGNPIAVGVSFLTNPAGKAILFLDFQCYTKPLPDNRLLVWHNREGQADSDPFSTVEFQLLDLCALAPAKDRFRAAEELRSARESVSYRGVPVARMSYATYLSPGTHSLEEVPTDFASLGEILVLANHAPREQTTNVPSPPSLAILAFDFNAKSVTVMPQDWYNRGSYDFGYEWVTRVARHPGTGHIFGEGIRLGFFRLDESGTNIDEWLVKDHFHWGMESPGTRPIVSQLLNACGGIIGRLLPWIPTPRFSRGR